MNDWIIACFFIALAVTALVAWPIAAHPTLPKRKKTMLVLIVMFVLMPLSLIIYLAVGTPVLGEL